MVAHDDMPLSATERDGLREYTKALQPTYKMPSEPTTTKKLAEKYETLQSKYGTIITRTDCLSLTVDVWTDSKNMQSYLGVTTHFRNGTNIESIELGVRFMPERKTSENLRTAMREICRDWQIQYHKIKGVVSDGGSNIKAAVRDEFGSDKHISCAAHLLNIVGQKALSTEVSPILSEASPSEVINVPEDEDEAEALLGGEEDESTDTGTSTSTPTSLRPLLMPVRRIVRFFKSSDVASTELKEAQIKKGRNPSVTLKLIQVVRTRWNSDYYMLDRYLELEEEVTTVLLKLQRERGSTKSKPPQITPMENVQILTEVRDLLKPLEEATKMLCKEKAVTLSNVIPIIFGLKKDTEKFLPSHGLVLNLQQDILAQIDKQFSGIELLRPYAAATLLDPRYKKYVFENPRAVGLITHLGNRIAANIAASEDSVPERVPPNVNPGSSSGIWAAVDERLQSTGASTPGPEFSGPGTLPSQLKAYLSAPTVDRSSNPNPLVAWKTMRPGLEHVYDVAMEYLPIMATSVASERLFSHAGMTATQRRSRLSPKHLNMLVFLRSVTKDVWFGRGE